MRKLKISKILTILIISSFLLISINSTLSTNITQNSLGLRNNTKDRSYTIYNNSNSIWKTVEKEQNKEFLIKGNIFGYAIFSESGEIVEDNEKTSTCIIERTENQLNIAIHTKFGIWSYDHLNLRGSIVEDKDGDFIFSYNMENIKKGFFADIYIYPDIMQISMAFDGGERQLCYSMLTKNGYSKFNALYPDEFEPSRLINNDITFTSTNNLDDMKNALKESEISSITITKLRKNLINIDEQNMSRSFTQTYYGLSYECWDFDVEYPEELPDDYWEPETKIDIGIHRFLPSEAQVKSDLQYYNKDYSRGMVVKIKDVLAFSMGTHGGPFYAIYDEEDPWVTIYPDEIEDLWFHEFDWRTGVETDVFPWDCICMADLCFGYNHGTGDPTMAMAFVDYGASAYVGATIPIPWDTDIYMSAFWTELCMDDKTVEDSLITMCNLNESWNVGVEWMIYGDVDAILSN